MKQDLGRYVIDTSPDGARRAVFTCLGEIRFGPNYFSLEVDGVTFEGRIFGEPSLWSADSQYLALQEWETIKESEGPITRLLLLDVQGRMEIVLARAVKGMAIPVSFDGRRMTYKLEFYSWHGKTEEEHTVDVESLNGWRSYPLRENR